MNLAKKKSITMKNAVVLAICVAEYDDAPNLESVKGDLARYRDLFENQYHYQFYPKFNGEYDRKFRWKRAEINQFIMKHREKVFAEEQDEKQQIINGGKPDGIIFIFRGHGAENGKILTSTGASQKITHYHDLLSSSGWTERAQDIESLPRIFIIDACRGNREVQPKDDIKNKVEAQGPGDDQVKQEEKGNDIGTVNVERAMLSTVYGNPTGFKTFGYKVNGGALSQAVITVFKQNVDSPQRFGDLLIDMNAVLKTMDQLINIEGDPTVNKVVIKKNKPPFDDQLLKEIDDVQQWMELVLNGKMTDFYESVRDGIQLCHLLNVIEPNICTPTYPAIDIETQYLNREEFIAGCKKLGVDERFIMKPKVLDNEENIVSMIINIYALVISLEHNKNYNGATITKLEEYKYGGDVGGCKALFDTYIGRVDGSGKICGYGKTIYDDGSWEEGGQLNNKSHGWGTYHWASGQHYVGWYKDGLPDGYGKEIYPDGSVYDGGWKDGNRDGFCKYIFSSGAVYEGQFRNDAMNGYGVYTWSDGSKYEGEWKDDKKHGIGKKTDSAGNIEYDGKWRNGERVNM